MQQLRPDSPRRNLRTLRQGRTLPEQLPVRRRSRFTLTLEPVTMCVKARITIVQSRHQPCECNGATDKSQSRRGGIRPGGEPL